MARLAVYPKLTAALAALPPKMYALSSTASPTPIVRDDLVASDEHVARALNRIKLAHFIGGGDLELVTNLFITYIARLADVLQPTLALLASVVERETSDLPPMPTDPGAICAWHRDVLRAQHALFSDSSACG